MTEAKAKAKGAGDAWLLLATVLATGMAFIDATALNVALPALQADLGIGGATLLWVVNAYALPLSAFLLLGGSLGDRFGRRRVFLAGVMIFAASSLLCSLSQSGAQLLAARALQGIGAALMIPGSLALINASVAVERRGRVIGLWSALTVIATVLGPVLGGVFAAWGWWRGVFLINLPLALVILVVTRTRIAESRATDAAALDWLGGLLFVCGLLGISYACLASPGGGAGGLELACGGIGALLLVAFVWHQAATAAPMLPLGVYRNRRFAVANAVTLLLYVPFHAITLFLPLNLIQVQGYGDAVAGAALLPVLVLTVGFSPWAGKQFDLHGPRRLLIAAPLLGAVGFGLLAAAGVTAGVGDYWSRFLPGLAFLGAGMGMAVAPLSSTVMTSLQDERSGLASGINSTLSRLAAVLAVAGLGGIALRGFRRYLAAQGDALTGEAVAAYAAQFLGAAETEAQGALGELLRQAGAHSFSSLCWACVACCLLAAATATRFRADPRA